MEKRKYKTNPNVNFRETEAYLNIKSFIFEIDNSIKLGMQEDSIKSKIQKDGDLLDIINNIIEKTPLSSAPGRYANPAMAQVIQQIENTTENEYLKNSFGNKIRMDFGTGHELNFLCYLYELCKTQDDFNISNAQSILSQYFKIIRKYTRKFNIEAAGSRGCWSIDDYLLLPYVFGSSQNFSKRSTIEMIDDGLFKEAQKENSSVMLSNICKLPWTTINIGMLKMYDEEVLGKRVVTQHFIYSDLLPEKLVKNKQ